MLSIGKTTIQHLLHILVCAPSANILKTSKKWSLQEQSSQVSHILTSKSKQNKLSAVTLLLSQNYKECRDYGKIWPRVQNSRCTILGKYNKISIKIWTLQMLSAHDENRCLSLPYGNIKLFLVLGLKYTIKSFPSLISDKEIAILLWKLTFHLVPGIFLIIFFLNDI